MANKYFQETKCFAEIASNFYFSIHFRKELQMTQINCVICNPGEKQQKKALYGLEGGSSYGSWENKSISKGEHILQGLKRKANFS